MYLSMSLSMYRCGARGRRTLRHARSRSFARHLRRRTNAIYAGGRSGSFSSSSPSSISAISCNQCRSCSIKTFSQRGDARLRRGRCSRSHAAQQAHREGVSIESGETGDHGARSIAHRPVGGADLQRGAFEGPCGRTIPRAPRTFTTSEIAVKS